MRRLFLFACMVAVLGSGVAQAGGWKVGAHIGGLTVNDAENNQILFGGHLEMLLSSTFGVRGDVSYRSEEEFKFQSDDKDLAVQSTTLPITVSANLYIPLVVLKPYITAGVGWYVRSFDFSEDFEELDLNDEDETDFGWHLGVGANWALAPKVDLFGEYRGIFFGDDKSFGAVEDSVKDLDFSSHQITVGLTLLLGS